MGLSYFGAEFISILSPHFFVIEYHHFFAAILVGALPQKSNNRIYCFAPRANPCDYHYH
jgi:hypothetical protein